MRNGRAIQRSGKHARASTALTLSVTGRGGHDRDRTGAHRGHDALHHNGGHERPREVVHEHLTCAGDCSANSGRDTLQPISRRVGGHAPGLPQIRGPRGLRGNADRGVGRTMTTTSPACSSARDDPKQRRLPGQRDERRRPDDQRSSLARHYRRHAHGDEAIPYTGSNDVDQPVAVDLLQPDLHAARSERTVRILFAGGGLVDEHQHHRGVRMNLRDRGPHDRCGGLDRFLLGRGRDDLFGELRVVREEVTRQSDFAVAKSLSSESGEYDSSATVPLLAASSATFAAAGLVCWSGRYCVEVEPARHAGGGDQRYGQQERRVTDARRPASARRSSLRRRRPPSVSSAASASAASASPHRHRSVRSTASGSSIVERRSRRSSVTSAASVFIGHGTNSTFDILIWPPSRCRFTRSRQVRGSCLAPAELVTRDDGRDEYDGRVRRSSILDRRGVDSDLGDHLGVLRHLDEILPPGSRSPS